MGTSNPRRRLFYYRDSYRDYRERFRIIEITEIIEDYRDFSDIVGYGIRLASQKLSKIIEILFKIIEIIEIFGDIHYRRLSKWNLDNRKVWHVHVMVMILLLKELVSMIQCFFYGFQIKMKKLSNVGKDKYN